VTRCFALAACLLVLIVSGSLTACSRRSGSVTVFPIPGSRVVAPGAQISFRGVPADQLGSVSVTGSLSGPHYGDVRRHSDGHGESFLPYKQFTPGERVTVRTGLNIVGAKRGRFAFTVAQPAGGFPNLPLPTAPRVDGDIQQFHSRPDLQPAAATVQRSPGAADGDIFLGPQNGPVQKGPMILGPDGRLIWFDPLEAPNMAADVRVQKYEGKQVLTWWQGYLSAGKGVGQDVIVDSSYHRIADVSAANGLITDLHEFELTPRGTALITSYFPVWWDASSVHGPSRLEVQDSVVQEIDVKTGLLLYQWDSLDHVPLTDSYVPLPPRGMGHDYFHINSVELDHDADFVISARNTWAVYKIDHATGTIIWRLGGKHTSFKMGQGTRFAFQHDARIRASDDKVITLFDDGAGPPIVHRQSQGLKLLLDFKRMTATQLSRTSHSPPLIANFQGNYQQIKSGDDFFGWGQQSYFTEVSGGKVVLDGHFVGTNANYRVYCFPWSAKPGYRPAVAASAGKQDTVYASWNGATYVSSWRVLAGSAANRLAPVASAANRAFETSIPIMPRQYVAVQALDSAGHVLGTSQAIQPR
jgi:Arylsulfotransferase (ASST)